MRYRLLRVLAVLRDDAGRARAKTKSSAKSGSLPARFSSAELASVDGVLGSRPCLFFGRLRAATTINTAVELDDDVDLKNPSGRLQGKGRAARLGS